MKKRKTSLMVSLLLIMCMFLGACGNKAQTTPEEKKATDSTTEKASEQTNDEETIKIAFIYPLSGGSAESGNMCLDAANLAVKNINDAGGIKALGGKKLELVVFDGTSDPAQSKNVAERALSDKNIVAAVGSGSSALTLPMLPAFEKNQVPLLTFSNSVDITNQGYQYVFSITNRGTQLGEYNIEFLDYLNNDLGYSYKKVAIIYENSANGINMADGARKSAQNMGLEIVFDESYQAGNADFAPMITAIKNSGAEVVMPYGYMQEQKLIFSAMRDIDFYPLVMGNSNWPSFYEALGDATNGVVTVGNWNWNTKLVQENEEYTKIVKQFEDTYGYFMTEQSGPTYDAVKIIANALEICGKTDSVELRNTISANKFDGMQLTGVYEFNEKGENINGVPAVSQWQYGKPVAVYPIEYAGSEYIAPDKFE